MFPRAIQPEDGYITIVGEQQILDRMHHMLESAEKRVYLAASRERIEAFAPELTALLTRRIKVVLLSDRMPEGLKGAAFYRTEGKEDQVRLITDSLYVLTGELTGSRQDICLYSGQRVFVDTLKEAMRNEIKLIELAGKEKEDKRRSIMSGENRKKPFCDERTDRGDRKNISYSPSIFTMKRASGKMLKG